MNTFLYKSLQSLGFIISKFNELKPCFIVATTFSNLRIFLHFAMDPSKLNSPELQHFLTQEKEKAMANEVIAKLTSICWDKCITSTPGSKFSSSETSCLTHCAQRYMDMSMMIMKRFQSMH